MYPCLLTAFDIAFVYTDALNIIDIANEFVEDSEHRLTVFGKLQ